MVAMRACVCKHETGGYGLIQCSVCVLPDPCSDQPSVRLSLPPSLCHDLPALACRWLDQVHLQVFVCVCVCVAGYLVLVLMMMSLFLLLLCVFCLDLLICIHRACVMV